MKLYDRCMGACCEDIGLSISPEELEASYQKFLSRGASNVFMSDQAEEEFKKYYIDIHLLYPMLTFIKKNRSHPESPDTRRDRDVYHYTCKHFDSKKRICTIYAHRPAMCRTYPDKEFCRNPKCQWKKMVDKRKSFELFQKKNKQKKLLEKK